MADNRRDSVVAVDIGSSGVRCVAFADDYGILGTVVRDLETLTLADGTSSQTWDDVLGATRSGIAELVASSEFRVRGVSLSGTASSFAPSSRNDAGDIEVGDIMLWSDTRPASMPDAAVASHERDARYRRTVCPDHISYWPAKLRWFAATGEGASTTRFAGAKDYVFEHLTGEFWVDPMTAAATGVFDTERLAWDTETLGGLGVSLAQLPEFRPATASAPVLPSVAATFGLEPGTAIILGGMDGPLAQLGAAGTMTGVATCTVGTSIAYRAGVIGRTVDPAARVWCYPVFDDFWVVGGAGSNGGNVLTWLSGVVGKGADLGPLIADALALAPEPELLFLPYLNSERAPLWRDDVRGAIVGIAAHHDSTDLARAALDGIGAAALELADAVSDCVGTADQVRLTGGFLRQGAWAQLVTDSLGVPTCVPEPEASTSTGAAVIGWMGLGRARPEPPLPARAVDRREPDARVHAVLREKTERMRRTRDILYPPPSRSEQA